MKQFRNITAGPKGFYDDVGNLHMIESGAMTPEDVAFAAKEPSKDWFGSPSAEVESAEALSELDRLRAENAHLQAQLDAEVAQGASEVDRARADGDVALRRQVEDYEVVLEDYRSQIASERDRANAAERERDELAAKLVALDLDGNGKSGGSAPADPPVLSGKNKAELIDIAKAEGADVSDDLTVAEIKDAIEAKRAA